VPLKATEGDPKLFSYAYGQDPAVLIAKVTTTLGQSSSRKYTLAAPDAGGGKAWKVLARDVVLQSGGSNVATNPYGIAQVGSKLYIIDYDSQKIYLLGVNELNGLPEGPYTLASTPFDLGPGTTANLPANAKGQAIIALKNSAGISCLYALYIVYTPATSSTPAVWGNSILVKMKTDQYGTLSYDTKTSLGLNAQEMIPVTDSTNRFRLVIPCLGGVQQAGTTNGTASMIQALDPFAVSHGVTTLITGDLVGTTGYYDIKAVAASARSDGWVYILTGTYDTAYNQNWTLYRTTANNLLSATNQTISQSVSGSILTAVDSGTASPGYYWDIYYETGTAAAGDRLWFLKGSPIQINPAGDYSIKKFFDTGYGAGDIGGDNVDSAVLVAETMRQAALSVSLKRGLRGAPGPVEKEEEKKE
jgi:hypothetical protein